MDGVLVAGGLVLNGRHPQPRSSRVAAGSFHTTAIAALRRPKDHRRPGELLHPAPRPRAAGICAGRPSEPFAWPIGV
jgi:hypothetical protein